MLINFLLYIFYILPAVYLPIRGEEVNNEHNQYREIVQNGNLYDVFKENLDKFANSMGIDLNEKPSDSDKRSVANDLLYEEFKRRLDRLNNELTFDSNTFNKQSPSESLAKSPDKRSQMPACLYDIFKNKLDKIYNNLRYDENGQVFENNENRFKEVTNLQRNLIQLYGKQLAYKNTKRMVDEFVQNKDLPLQKYSYKEMQNHLNKLKDEITGKKKRSMKADSSKFSTQNFHDFSKSYTIGDAYQTGLFEFINRGNENPDVLINFDDFNIPGLALERQRKKRSIRNKIWKNVHHRLPRLSDSLSTYPAILAKPSSITNSAMEMNKAQPDISIHPSGSTLLTDFAKQINMTPLDLAKKLTTVSDANTGAIQNDPQLSKMLQKYIASTVNIGGIDANKAEFNNPLITPIQTQTTRQVDGTDDSKTPTCESASPSAPVESLEATTAAPENSEKIKCVLDKVMSKLENNKEESEQSPEGAPCEITGIWTSYVLGLQFTIGIDKVVEKHSENSANPGNCANEKEGEFLSIYTKECNPPKKHELMDAAWTFTGHAQNKLGGPFYIYAQKESANVLATFVGFCRTCGKIDTIFGSWTFLFPSKDCQDVSTSIENKRDILRRTSLDSKRRSKKKIKRANYYYYY